MGKKKRGHVSVDDILSRPWCYYCERDFEDLKLLISHQKAKHFKCDRCGKRLNTAGGLSVHMNQVHKESLDKVENALPNRNGLDIEIFGMEGVPEDVIAQHSQRIIQSYYQEQAERFAATGNPPPGQNGGSRPVKKIKIENADEIKARLKEWLRTKKERAERGAQNGGDAMAIDERPGQTISPFPPPNPGFAAPPFSQQGFPQAFPAPGAPPGAAFTPLPNRPPGGVPVLDGLPQRPGFDDPAGPMARHGDDIDQMIQMVTSGIKPAVPAAAQASGAAAGEAEDGVAADKKGKKEKEKHVRMVYSDTEFSPEERMARFARYAFVPEAA